MSFCWCTINCTDLEKSVGFYTEVVGLTVARRFKAGPESEIVFLKGREGSEIELIYHKGNTAKTPKEGISIGFTFDSLDTAIENAAKKGVPVAQGPVVMPNAKFCFVKDPDGVTVQFVEQAH
jgi:lactoylglutathione lyase